GVALPWAAFGYGAYLFFAVLLQVRIDLACMGLDADARARRARLVLAVLLLLLAGSVALAYHDLGPDQADLRLLRYALRPVLPFATVIASARSVPPEAMQELIGASMPANVALLLVLGAIALLAAGILGFRGDVREAAHHTSVKLQARIERIRRGRALM